MRVDEKDGGVHRVHGRAFVRERADDRTYRVGSGGFWQVHPQAADTLVRAVMQGLLPRKNDTALDLYCGVGLFAGAIGQRIGEKGAVLGIESGKRAVEDARHNLKDLDRVRIEHGKVDQVLPRTGITECDLIVLDPPRAGVARPRSSSWSRSARAASRTWRATRRPWPGTSRTSGTGVPGADAAGVRPVPDDAPRGVRGDSGAGEEGRLTCGYAVAAQTTAVFGPGPHAAPARARRAVTPGAEPRKRARGLRHTTAPSLSHPPRAPLPSPRPCT